MSCSFECNKTNTNADLSHRTRTSSDLIIVLGESESRCQSLSTFQAVKISGNIYKKSPKMTSSLLQDARSEFNRCNPCQAMKLTFPSSLRSANNRSNRKLPGAHVNRSAIRLLLVYQPRISHANVQSAAFRTSSFDVVVAFPSHAVLRMAARHAATLYESNQPIHDVEPNRSQQ